MSIWIREQLHKQIDQLPDHLVERIADFTRLITHQPSKISEYANWQDKDWQDFALEQFFRGEEEAEYSLEDAKEIYSP